MRYYETTFQITINSNFHNNTTRYCKGSITCVELTSKVLLEEVQALHPHSDVKVKITNIKELNKELYIAATGESAGS